MPYEVVTDSITNYELGIKNSNYQPPATAQTLMSSKDLRGIRLLPKFVGAGIASAKIEGRMKGPLYAATTVRTYAEALRWVRTQPPETWPERLEALSVDLEQLPHRGYTEASLEQPAEADSLQLESGPQGEAELAGVVLEVRPEKSLTVLSRNVFEAGTPLELLPIAGTPVLLSTSQMRDSSSQPLQRATPHRLVTFPWVPGALPWTVVRMPRRKQVQQQAV
jgi:putative protease